MTFRLPWVSRAFHDAVVGALQAETERRNHERLDAVARAIRAERIGEREAHEKRYSELLARYHTLKLQGFTEVQPVQPREALAVDPIARAIRAKAGSDRKLREQMELQAARDKADGVAETDILLRIQMGVSGDELVTL